MIKKITKKVSRTRILKWALGIILFGIVFAISFNQFRISTNGAGTVNSTLGLLLYFIGFAALTVFVVRIIWKKTRNNDERADFIGKKALGLTYLALIIEAFVIIITDGISPIATPYHLVMTYLVVISLVVYLISYRILSKFY